MSPGPPKSTTTGTAPDRKSLEDHPAAKLTDGWKDQHVCTPQALYRLDMAEHATERHARIDPERLCFLLERRAIRTISDDAEPCRIFSQKRRDRAQRHIATLVGN